MSGNKLVSVIIPTYNRADFLPLAIRSVLDQTYSHLEVHVVDDGSTDSTKDVMRAFVADGRVHYHPLRNRGVSSARNTGIRAARGDVIALCDSDDLWLPNKLASQLPLLEKSPGIGVVYTDAELIDLQGRRLPDAKSWGAEHRLSGRITDKLLVLNFVTGSTSIIRRECFDRVGLYDESLITGEDYDLWLRISTQYEYAYLNQVTYLYRQWEGQVSNGKNEFRFYEDSMRIKRHFLERYGHLVPPNVVDDVWAESFTGRGLCRMKMVQDRFGALTDILRALRHKPAHLSAWKAAVKVLVNRV